MIPAPPHLTALLVHLLSCCECERLSALCPVTRQICPCPVLCVWECSSQDLRISLFSLGILRADFKNQISPFCYLLKHILKHDTFQGLFRVPVLKNCLIATAVLSDSPDSISKCFAFAAKKQSFVLVLHPSWSIPKKYFELSHKKLADTPEDLATISGTSIIVGTHTVFFPAASPL